MTNDLEDRVFDHKIKRNKKSFTARYNCNQLVYYEEFITGKKAIDREKQLKKYNRQWKINLINSMNSGWQDLSKDWFAIEEFEIFRKFDK